MKLFRWVRKGFRTIGMYPTKSSDGQRCPFNLTNSLVLISTVQLFISSSVFFVFKAEAIGDRADSFYMSISHLLGVWHAAVTIWRSPQMFKLFETFERFIDARKFNSRNLTEHVSEENNWSFFTSHFQGQRRIQCPRPCMPQWIEKLTKCLAFFTLWSCE